ncbi:superfamily II DNA/RNA helicase, partial [Paraburkholderia sp. GAS41]
HHNHPAPLRSASLHQQQRNEIMKNFRYGVNRIFLTS